MSPRFVPVTVTELSRAPLLAAIPGADLIRLAERLERVEAGPGEAILASGDPAAAHAIILSGLAATTGPDGARVVLRPGDTFDAAAAPGAGLTAMMPCVAVRCDARTFEEMIRPHLGGGPGA